MGTFAYVDINELAALFSSEAGRILASVGRQAAAAECARCLQRTGLIWTITFTRKHAQRRSRCGSRREFLKWFSPR